MKKKFLKPIRGSIGGYWCLATRQAKPKDPFRDQILVEKGAKRCNACRKVCHVFPLSLTVMVPAYQQADFLQTSP
ncbi:MAG: hypothetical protein R2828_28860 [Saprospiraceae bacterium]